MNEPLLPSPDSGGATPDERMRETGAQLVLRLAACIRVGRSYSVSNQVFVKQIEALLEAVRPVLETQGEAVLVALERDLFLNGARIPVARATVQFHEGTIELFTRLGIAGVRFESEADAAAMTAWFQLALEADCPRGADLASACEMRGITGVVPVIAAGIDPEHLAAAGAGGPGAAEAARSAQDAAASPEVIAERRFAQALSATRALMQLTALREGLQIRHVKRIVQPLVEGAAQGIPVVVGLASLRRREVASHAHAVTVCAVAVSMGQVLGLDRRALADIGVAALLHDLGKLDVAAHVANELAAFTLEDRAWVERHPVEGAKRIARSTTLGPTTLHCIRVALEHHAVGASAYPRLPAGWVPSLLSRIVATADCFVSLLHRQGTATQPVAPAQALAMLLGPLSNSFEPALLWALARTVGFYPAGQVVELDDGARAIVLAPNVDDPARPHLRLLAADETTPSEAPPVEHRPLPPNRSVRRALSLAEYPESAAA